MQAIRIETTLEKDGELVLHNLPCKKDQKVEVIVLVASAADTPAVLETGRKSAAERPAIWEKLSGMGKGLGLPSDLAQQHDHYAHGTPKR